MTFLEIFYFPNLCIFFVANISKIIFNKLDILNCETTYNKELTKYELLSFSRLRMFILDKTICITLYNPIERSEWQYRDIAKLLKSFGTGWMMIILVGKEEDTFITSHRTKVAVWEIYERPGCKGTKETVAKRNLHTGWLRCLDADLLFSSRVRTESFSKNELFRQRPSNKSRFGVTHLYCELRINLDKKTRD